MPPNEDEPPPRSDSGPAGAPESRGKPAPDRQEDRGVPEAVTHSGEELLTARPTDPEGAVENVAPVCVETTWEAGDRRVSPPIGWIVLVAVVLGGLLVVGLLGTIGGDERMERQAAARESMLAEQRQEEARAARLSREIQKAAAAYLGAETVEEKARHVRMPERVRPLMEDYYERHPLRPVTLAGFFHFEPISLENHPFILLTARQLNGGDIVLMLEEDEDGTVRVDWESHVAYQEMSLEEFVEKRPAEAMDFRVYVTYDEYYAHQFADADRYVSLSLSERDSPGFLFGYVERGGGVHERIVEILGREFGESAPMILKLRFPPEGRGIRSVLVEEVVAPGWTLVGPPEHGE